MDVCLHYRWLVLQDSWARSEAKGRAHRIISLIFILCITSAVKVTDIEGPLVERAWIVSCLLGLSSIPVSAMDSVHRHPDRGSALLPYWPNVHLLRPFFPLAPRWGWKALPGRQYKCTNNLRGRCFLLHTPPVGGVNFVVICFFISSFGGIGYRLKITSSAC